MDFTLIFLEDRRYVMPGPAERVEQWADFSRYPVGKKDGLCEPAFRYIDTGKMGGMRGGDMMRGGQSLPNGSNSNGVALMI